VSELEAFGVALGVWPPDPFVPMFGQLPVWFGRVVPPEPGVVGVVVAFGDGDADGSAAETAAAPPTTSRPAARNAVAMPRRRPPDLTGDAVCVTGCSVQSMGSPCTDR
jgi:hypothetical protein